MTPPSSTYRLQFGPDLSFADAAALVPYLAALGAGAVYASPLLQAMPGSTHGYDVADPTRVSAELGGEEGRRALVAAVREAGLQLVVDLVPNHVGVAVPSANPAWADLLRNGPASRYAGWFDVVAGGRLRVPVLGDDGDGGAAALAQLEVDRSGAEPVLRYHATTWPLAPGTADLGTAQEVHDAQHYELVSWRADLSYRRFFAVSDLAAVRVEDPEVFEATHAEVLRWVAEGDVDGLRVDHPDGLADPRGYAARLREHAPDAWIVVEKILEPGEELPAWPVDGTTGYDALAEVDGVLVDPAGEEPFTDLDAELTGVRTDWAELVHDCKLDVATGMLRPELHRLAALAGGVPSARDALAEVLACFPVYRSYLPQDGVEHLDAALAAARRRRPDLAGALDALSPRLHDGGDELGARFQQTSGAVMAKAVEDTAYYRWTRFVALNEVGGDPARFGLPPSSFAAALDRRESAAPRGMTTLSTHDTKRSADVRARLAVLAERPGRWTTAVHEFTALASAAGAPVPDPALGHLLWQTVVGAWPIPPDRLHAYVEKAMREARTRTTWTDPDPAFEAGLHAVADAALADGPLRDAIAGLVAEVADAGWSNALSAVLLQLTMPGVPDTYQGGELWDLSLVDPDNRRPVDWALRRTLLDRLDEGWLPEVDDSGAAKLLVVSRVLRARRDAPERFTGFGWLPAQGPAAEHAVAYERRGAVAVATRLPIGLAAAGGWTGTTLPLPEGRWTDALTGASTGGAVPLADVLARYPVALLLRG